MANIVSASNACYFLTWTNFLGGTNGFYTPYVVYQKADGTLHGHEQMDEFIDFFNDPRSIFAVNQRAALQGSVPTVAPGAAAEGVTGYVTFPAAGRRILEETTFTAKLHNAQAGARVQMRFTGESASLTLDAATEDGIYYSAVLTKEALDHLGLSANGTVQLLADGKPLTVQDHIFGIPEKVKDPHVIDDFEDYMGQNALLGREWSINKATGCSIDMALTDEQGQTASGHGLKFTYSEISGGWGGATVSKEVDWSGCNALQFWTIPDANAQRVVIQISANGRTYEAYMNYYDEYNAQAGQPTLVTIPFEQFHQRDTEGRPKGGLEKDCANITGFGLWVNAEDNGTFVDGVVSGTIWYDDIAAIKTTYTETTFETP